MSDDNLLIDTLNELVFEFEVAGTPELRNKLRNLIISVIEKMVELNEVDPNTLENIKSYLIFE